MNKTLAKIFAAIFLTLCLVSCSAEMMPYPEHNNDQLKEGYTVIISGTASDVITAEPLENVKITLQAAEITDDGHGILYTRNAYTDNRGRYELKESGFSKKIICWITAEDQTEKYKSAEAEMTVSWSGPSFDAKNGIFYANDIDFYLEKVE